MNSINTWQNSNLPVYGITVLFFALSLWGILHHELWLDEAHHYLLARDSHSFQNLVLNTQYEGHPITWNVILFWITRMTTDPIWMQILHISIMTITVGIFLKKAPFSWGFKLLFIFGYFMFYEYNIISRNYNLGILFIFLACSLYQKRTTKFIAIASLLGIACNSHAIFLILASGIMLLILSERFQVEKLRVSKNTWIGLFIFGALALISLLQIIPPADTPFFERGQDISLLQKIPKSISPFFKGIFLIPDITQHSFWNTNIVVNYSRSIAGIFAIISLIIPYLLFYRNKKLMYYLYFGIIATGLFFFVTSLNAARYYGILFLFLITALWFDVYAFAKAKKNKPLFLENTLKKIRPVLIYGVLGLHFISGIYAFSMDAIYPFTTAKQAAQYLEDHNYLEKTIATKACNGTALSAYIGKSAFFTKTQSFQSYCSFNKPEIRKEQGTIAMLKSIRLLLASEQSSIIFVTHEPLFNANKNKVWTLHNEAIEIEFLKQFDGSIVNKGNHYIYEISSYASINKE